MIGATISYGAALGMDLAFGYSINRVTLFALILALGLIVDDPIASIDNIADTDAALECVKEFNEPACVIVKHANPCGVALGKAFSPLFLFSTGYCHYSQSSM